MIRARDPRIPATRIHHDSLAGAFTGPGRDELLHALHLCLQGERVFTSELRREVAARGVDFESLARAVQPGYN